MTDPDPIAALAAQLQELRGQLARYTGETGHLRARLEKDSSEVAMLRVEVKQSARKLKEEIAQLCAEAQREAQAEVREELERLGQKLDEAIGKRKADDPAAPYWLGLPQDERAVQLGDLREWVETVARVQWPAYLASLPPCWPAHGEAVWELGNLMTEWRRIYSDPDARPLPDALVYFDRWLPGVLGRLERALKCDASGCRLARPSRPWERPPPRYT